MDTERSRTERILRVILSKDDDLPSPMSRIEELLIELNDAIKAGGSGNVDLAAKVNDLELAIQSLAELVSDLGDSITAIQNQYVKKTDIPVLSQDEYDNLQTKDALLYLIKED